MAKYILVHSVQVCTAFTSETYGRLWTLGPKFRLPYGNKGRYSEMQVCACECGTIKVINSENLARGLTTSCGCRQKEIATTSSTTHGLSHLPEYAVWNSMKQRCDNNNVRRHGDYGGRGIGYCERWKKFEHFFADMGLRPSPSHTIERADNHEDYGPDNCTWEDRTTQANNTRANHMITIADKTDTLANWCRAYAIAYKPVHSRLQKGWPVIEALTTPIRPIVRKTKPE